MRLRSDAYTSIHSQALIASLQCLVILAITAGCARDAGRPAPGDTRPADAPPSRIGHKDGQSAYGRGVDQNTVQKPGLKETGSYDSFDNSIYLPTNAQNLAQTDKRTGNVQVQSEAMQPQGSAAGRSRVIKIGLLVPLSGQGKNVGKAMLNAAQMAIFDMEADNFHLLPRDTKGTAAGARKAAQDVVENGARLIIGPLFADSVRTAGNVAAEHNVNVIGYSTDWRVAGGNVLTMGFLPYNQVRRVISYARQNGYQKYGVIAPDNNYGDAVMASYTPLVDRLAIETADVMRYNKGDANISQRVRQFTQYDKRIKQFPLASQVRDKADQAQKDKDQSSNKDKPGPGETIAEGPPPFEAVLMAVGGDQARAVANLLSYYDLQPDQVKRLGTGLWDDAGLSGESNLDGGWYAAPDPRLRADFENRYQQNYDTKPPRLATLGYDSTALAIVLGRRGLKQSGKPAYDRNDLTTPNGFAGIDGIFRFRKGGLVDRGLAVLEIDDGEIEVISPAPRTFQRPKRGRSARDGDNNQSRTGTNRDNMPRQRTSY